MGLDKCDLHTPQILDPHIAARQSTLLFNNINSLATYNKWIIIPMNISLGQPLNAVIADHELHQMTKIHNDLTYIYIYIPEMSFGDKASGPELIAIQNGLMLAVS